ncbi:MAG: hypothetical protein M1827_004801 [Pycnora praestabilis]|nr:MAG: hypothetical protein M1827_004801 [Pycnora praestabilis]
MDPSLSRREINVIQNLETARVRTLPCNAYYIPNFVSEEEEKAILRELSTAGRWINLQHRRLQVYPSQLTKTNKLLAEPLPDFLTCPVVDRLRLLRSTTIAECHFICDSPHGAPNHVLVNEYQPGQGIMAHEDGAAYHPVVATVSLGGSTVLDIYEKTDEGKRGMDPSWRILQEPRSLLITSDSMYKDYMHGIAEVDVDEQLNPKTVVNWDLLGSPGKIENAQLKRQTRTSLTYRDVLKVSKVGSVSKYLARR